MRLKSHYYQITDLLSSQSDKHRSSQGDDSSHQQPQQIPRLIKKRWQIRSPLSSGSFGDIYQGENLLTNEKVAVKFQLKSASPPQLARESRIYRSIEGFGMPKMYWYELIPSEKRDTHLCSPKGMALSIITMPWFSKCSARASKIYIIIVRENSASKLFCYLLSKCSREFVIYIVDVLYIASKFFFWMLMKKKRAKERKENLMLRFV